jgi:hypothetical protein
MNMSSAWLKLKLAMHVLVGPEPPRERLARCYTAYLADLKPRDLPLEVRSEFSSLALKLSRGEGRSIRNAREALDAVPDMEVLSIMHSIVDMHDAVTRYQPLLTVKEYDTQRCRPSDGDGKGHGHHRCNT